VRVEKWRFLTHCPDRPTQNLPRAPVVDGCAKGFKRQGEFTKDNRDAIFIAEKPKGKKGISLMLPMNAFAQIMNSFSEQSFFDHQISQEQYLLCKNEAGVIEVWHVE
jgi:hypothetical protein